MVALFPFLHITGSFLAQKSPVLQDIPCPAVLSAPEEARLRATQAATMSREESLGTSAGSEDDASSPGVSQQLKKKSSKPSKARLTSAQKNTNHRDAENKRRDGIRDQFQQLSNIVPGCEGMAKSEQFVLTTTGDYIEKSLTNCREIMAEMERRGLPIDPKWRAMLTDEDFGGSNHQTPAMAEYEAKKQRAEERKGPTGQPTEKGCGEEGDG